MTAPAVSVVIPFYRSRYLQAAIDSVEAQSFADHEIIVVDDGSPDDPVSGGRPIGERGRLQYLRQENRGPAAARNTGIRAARGTFLAFLDADDSWEPTYLQEQLGAINQDPGFDLIYCNALMMGQPEAERGRLMEATVSRGLVTCTGLLREEYTVYLSGVVAKREAVAKAGLFDEQFIHGEDFDLWLRMIKAGARMGFQRRVLLNRRLHSGSLSYDALTHSEKALLVLEKFGRRTDLTGPERAAVEWRIKSLHAEAGLERAKRAVERGDFETATRALRTANQFHRSWKLWIVELLLRLWPTMIARAHELRERRRLDRLPVGK